MTTRRDIEPVLDRWLAEGPTRIADRVVFGALETIDHTEQLRRPRWLRRSPLMSPFGRLAAAAAAIVVLGVGALVGMSLISKGPNAGGATPQPSAATLSQPHLTAGVTYRITPFSPAFTIKAAATDWALVGLAGPATAFFAEGPSEPDPPDVYTLNFIVPSQVLPAGGGNAQPAPADLITWLQGQSDLVLGSPTTTQVGGLPARVIDGTIASTASFNQDDNRQIMCTVGSCGPTFGNELAIRKGTHFEIFVVAVRGQTVVILGDASEATWAAGHKPLDDMLASVAFPN